VALAASLTLAGLPAHADERAELEQLRATTMALMQALIDNGLLTKDKADEIVRQAQRAAPAPAQTANAETGAAEKAKPPVIRIPYITESAKAEIRDQVKKEVLAQAHDERWGEPGTLPDWMRRITVEGDVRVRWEDDLFDKNNLAPDAVDGYLNQIGRPLAWSPDLANTQHNRDRMTLRARLGLRSDLGDGVSAGVRLSTGNATTSTSTSNPSSESQTLGSSLNKYSVVLDRAYIAYKGASEFEAQAGRFGNPFFGTDLTWPDDLNFDGVAVAYKPTISAGNSLFFTAGAFPLLEFETSTKDKWLYGTQVGGSFNLAPQTQMRLGLAAYKFSGIEGVPETATPPANGTAQSIAQPYLITEYKKGLRQKGNTLYRINQSDDSLSDPSVWGLASKFTPINLSAELKFTQFYPFNIRVSLDYVDNLGFDIDEIRKRTNLGTDAEPLNLAKQTAAYQTKVTIGADQVDKPGQWQSSLTFRRMERDAWVDAFTDTNWNLGGTNYQGWSLAGAYGIANRVSLGLRWISTRSLPDTTNYSNSNHTFTGPGLSNVSLKIDVLQIELNARF
jgi:hypothetical protein